MNQVKVRDAYRREDWGCIDCDSDSLHGGCPVRPILLSLSLDNRAPLTRKSYNAGQDTTFNVQQCTTGLHT